MNKIPVLPLPTDILIKANYNKITRVNRINPIDPSDNHIGLHFADSCELLNARIGYNLPGNPFGFSIWGKNLLEKVYLLDNSPARGIPSVWYGSPRTFGIEVHYNFLR